MQRDIVRCSMAKRLLVLSFIAVLVGLASAQERAPQNESIKQEDLRADLFFLAGDAMRGRLTDTEENRATADYLRSRFERMGLKPAGPNNSYFQPYNLMTATLGEGSALDVVSGDGATRQLRAGQEFYPQRFSASGRATGTVVFAGFGISAPRLHYDDYGSALRPGSGLSRAESRDDIAGRIVLALDHEPGERDP